MRPREPWPAPCSTWQAYPIFRLSDSQQKLFRAWDRLFPPDGWECERERRIARLQGNDNPFVRQACDAQAARQARSLPTIARR